VRDTIKIQEFNTPRMTRRLYREVDEGAKAFWARRGLQKRKAWK